MVLVLYQIVGVICSHFANNSILSVSFTGTNYIDVHLLVSSYMGSWSTFTADLVTSTSMFYINEPLAYMLPWGYLSNNGPVCNQRATTYM